MLKAYKTEIKPTSEQAIKIRQTIGACRFIYNKYLAENIQNYKDNGTFISGMDFSKWLNNDFIPNNPEFIWIKEVSSKSVKQSIMNGDKAFKNFFKGKTGFPKFKKKGKSDVKMYFVKNNSTDCLCERHKIKIPSLGWIRLKEKGFIPTNQIIKSGTISIEANRYYISVLVNEEIVKPKLNDFGIGIDLGLKDFAICSDGKTFKNINKSSNVKKLEKKLKREQRCLSRKYEFLKKRGGTATRQNIQKQQLKVQKIHQRLTNIRTNYLNQCINEIVKTKPSYIVLEDLNISGMMKNKHLSKAIQNQKFYEFRNKLKYKCKQFGIELRIVDRWYPSSKTCHNCGNIKKTLRLSDRKYICNCGYVSDRDYNASLNLRDAKTYKIA